MFVPHPVHTMTFALPANCISNFHSHSHFHFHSLQLRDIVVLPCTVDPLLALLAWPSMDISPSRELPEEGSGLIGVTLLYLLSRPCH